MSAAPATTGPPVRRPRRPLLVVLVVVGILVVLGIAGAIAWSVARTANGPDAAVREYVAMIAAGDASGANAAVDPTRPDPEDPADAEMADALLGDTTLAASLEPLVPGEIGLGFDETADVAVGETVEVSVEYAVGDRPGSATLRVERTQDGAFGVVAWRILDPLVLPVVLESNVPEAGPALLGGSPIALSGSAVEGATQRTWLVYPGEYEISAPTSTYLAAAPERFVVVGDTEGVVADPALRRVTSSQVWFTPTALLIETMGEALAEHLDECLAAGAAMAEDCPAALKYVAATGTDLVLTDAPEVDFLGAAQTEHVGGEPVEPRIRMRSTIGEIEYTTASGSRFEESFQVVAGITAAGDEIEVEFRPNG
jgi:hypothetical protein